MKSVVVIGTVRRLQGADKSPRQNIDDPSFRKLVELFISTCGVDFIFEEASGCGPTDAERIAISHRIRYTDIDLHEDERRRRGLPVESGRAYVIDGGKPEDCYVREYLEVHAQREDSWLQEIRKHHFNSALIICGVFHVLSLSLKLGSAGFDVDCICYAPFHKLWTTLLDQTKATSAGG